MFISFVVSTWQLISVSLWCFLDPGDPVKVVSLYISYSEMNYTTSTPPNLNLNAPWGYWGKL